jgi:hypothetical protein
MVKKSATEEAVFPELDLVTPAETEYALFALG